MRRRTLILGFGLTPLTACAAMPALSSTSQLASDVELIAAGLGTVVTDVQQIPGVANTILAKLGGYLAIITADAGALAETQNGQPQPLAQQVATAVEDFAQIVLPLVPHGAQWAPFVQAAVDLLPAVLAAAGVATASRAPRYGMTPAQARARLRAAVSKR